MKSEPSDHILNLTKAVVSAVPLVGGPIASLMGDYILTSKQQAAEQAIQFFTDKLTDLLGRIDTNLVNKTDFAELFNKYRLVVMRTNREEKLRAAANILANVCLRPGDPAKSPYEELDHLMHCVDALTIGAISVLGAGRHITRARPGGNTTFHFSELRRHLPHLTDASLLLSLASELRALNLLHFKEPAIDMPDHEAYLLQVTPIGERFAERFIEGRM